MRSVPAGSYARLSSPLALWRAYQQCRRGKTRHPSMAGFDLDADREVFALARELAEGRYVPRAWRLRVIRDPKTRLIAAPAIRDRVVQRALVDEIGPTYERGFIDQHFACGVGRGAHRAALAFLRAMRRRRFALRLDIASYFASVDHGILLDLYAHRLRDARSLQLIGLQLDSAATVYAGTEAQRVLGREGRPGYGLALGSHLSQWSGSLYLDGLDHFVKRELKVRDYLRYMDDFVLFGDDEAALVAQRGAIEKWLWEKRRLRLNPKLGAVVGTDVPLSWLGFRVSRAAIGPGRKLRRRLRSAVQRAALRGPAALEQCLNSYRGLLVK